MRQPGNFGDLGGNAFATPQVQRISGQRLEHKSGNFYGRIDHSSSENEQSLGTPKVEGQWRYERDGFSNMLNEGQGAHLSKSYYQGQRSDPRLTSEKQGNEARLQHPEQDLDIGNEVNVLLQNFEVLEQRFLEEIMKLGKEQADAEDAENARHRVKLNTINVHYEEQLDALRARHRGRREEFLRMESHARQQQYHLMDQQQYANSGLLGPIDLHGYGPVSGPAGGELQRGYEMDHYDPSYRERPRLTGSNRDHGFEPRVPPGGRAYGSGSGSGYY